MVGSMLLPVYNSGIKIPHLIFYHDKYILVYQWIPKPLLPHAGNS